MDITYILSLFCIAFSIMLFVLANQMVSLQQKINLLQYWIRQNRKEINRMIIFPLPDIDDPWAEKAHKRRADT